MKAENILKTIGQTPIIRINKMFEPELNVWIKLEHLNPGGSIKDRIALAMIEDAETRGLLDHSKTIIEPTSGNTGIGLAMVAAVKSYDLILVMPDSMSVERRNILTAYGAKLVLTPRTEGMKGAINKAIELSKVQPSWMPMQFENTSNPMVHYAKTAIEILKDFDGSIDFLITGVGTGGHISGISRALKKEMPQIKVMAVEPIGSDVIGGGNPGPHAIQGIGAGFIPENLDLSMIDGTISISKEEAFEFCKNAAKLEGLLVGISTGASLAAISKMSTKLKDKTVLTLSYDRGDRYLSVEGLFN
ncbi:MAG: cysteine synthase A [Bacteroidetes bacterium HGW-Bacteroidetes-17]|jgi:cysteine synthase A|nr:MAG: cysteine synthase A [Bacteroidetes bacterium HGW-Bacteroidetes-17]